MFTAIKNTGSWYQVENDAGQTVMCRIKGVFRLRQGKTTNPVAVGDRVDYALEADGTGVITRIEERDNYIIRRASNLSKEAHIIAANLDRAFIVVTLDFPETKPEFIDRFLVTAEAYNVPAAIVLNKTDLYTEEYSAVREEFRHTYSLAGYSVHEVSAKRDTGVEALRELLRGRVSLLAGNSGVGKSTLIHAIDPALNPKTGEISAYHNRGNPEKRRHARLLCIRQR